MGYILATVVIATLFVWSPSVHSLITKDNGVCGSTKGCFSVPADCNPDVAGSCRAFSSWSLTADNTSLLINLYCSTTTYIAMGFSKSGGMMDSDVYSCTSEDINRSRNAATGRSNEPEQVIGVTDAKVVFVNGTVSCSFVRELQLTGDGNFYNLTSPNKYTPILAWGGREENGRLSMHPSADTGAGNAAIDFDGRGSDGSGSDLSAKSHGTVIFFMLLCFFLVMFIE